MTNVALGKSVEEDIKNPATATDGVIAGYTGFEGFADFPWPGTLTVDLEQTESLLCVRFLLWDGLGTSGNQRSKRLYKYRLLTSVDNNAWDVLYDASIDGTNGWQEFTFSSPLPARYIRIHGLWNSANQGFHIVELEAHNSAPPALTAEIALKRILSGPSSTERGDALPMEARMQELIAAIERLVEENSILNPQPFQELTAQLKTQVRDVAALERSVDSIRREIVGPVQKELLLSKQLGKFSVWGFWVGIVGGILAIISILLTLLR